MDTGPVRMSRASRTRQVPGLNPDVDGHDFADESNVRMALTSESVALHFSDVRLALPSHAGAFALLGCCWQSPVLRSGEFLEHVLGGRWE